MPEVVARLEGAAADIRREGSGGAGRAGVGGRAVRRGRRRGRRGPRSRQLPADARAAREAGRDPSLATRQQLAALSVVGATRAEACPCRSAPSRAHCAPSPTAPSGAICIVLAAPQAADLPRTDALHAGGVEAALLDAVRIHRAVADTRNVGQTRAGDTVERWTRRLAVEAPGAVRGHGAALRHDALVAVAAVGPGTVGDAVVAATAEHLARRVDAEGAVRAAMMAPAGGQVLRREACGRSGHGARLARLQRLPPAPAG